MTDEPVTIPAGLVERVRDANAVWLATVGPHGDGRARWAAMNARSAVVRELLAYVVRETPDDARPCTTCEEPTGNPDTFCDACSAEMDDPVVASQNTKESML